MKDPTTLSDQISCLPLPPSLDIHRQEGKQLAGYSQHTVRQDQHQPYEEPSPEIFQSELTRGHTAPVGSHVNYISSMAPQKISGGGFRMVPTKDAQSLYLLQVQSLVEGCLQQYMNKKEVVEDLLHREKVEPSYTQIVLQKLEEQNEEFFKAYHLRLLVKQQIIIFNKLLEKQFELMNEDNMCPAGVSSLPVSSGSHSLPTNQNMSYYDAEHEIFPLRPAHINQPAGSSNVIINSGSTMPPDVLTNADTFVHPGGMDPTTIIPLEWHLNSSMKGFCGLPTFKPLLSGQPDLAFNADANVLDPNSTTFGEAPLASLGSAVSKLQTTHDSFLDHDMGFSGQIQQISSCSDLPTEFASDAIGSYSEPAFQGTQIDSLEVSLEGELQDNKLFHTAFPHGLNYEELFNG